jgi:hypothetical protein
VLHFSVAFPPLFAPFVPSRCTTPVLTGAPPFVGGSPLKPPSRHRQYDKNVVIFVGIPTSPELMNYVYKDNRAPKEDSI